MRAFVSRLLAPLQISLLGAVLWSSLITGCQQQEPVKPDPEALKKEAQELERQFERESQNK